MILQVGRLVRHRHEPLLPADDGHRPMSLVFLLFSMLSRRKNPLNLSLPATVCENGDQGAEPVQDSNTVSMEAQLKQMTLTEPQKQRMQEWIQEKKLVSFLFYTYPVQMRTLPLQTVIVDCTKAMF